VIAILQFDAVNLPIFHGLLEQRRLRATTALRERGQWYTLESPVPELEGATFHSLHSGLLPARHGLHFPFMWSASEQRVRPEGDFPGPEPVWDRIGRANRRALLVDPYEARRPEHLTGLGLSAWQFRHPITLHAWSVPDGVDRVFGRRFGRPTLVGEVYGRPSSSHLSRMRNRLLTAPGRVADAVTYALARESFDLVWVTMVAAHIAGHWFLDPARLGVAEIDQRQRDLLQATLVESYTAVDDALSRILADIPRDADVIMLSSSGMGPNTSRTHLLPGMLQAILSGGSPDARGPARSGGSLWRLRAMLPTDLRALVARVLPERLILEITARLELRGMDWSRTRAFMPPSGDCGYVRLNLRGREREGIVDPADADPLLEEIAAGLRTFCGPDGRPVVESVLPTSTVLGTDTSHPYFPDLVVRWNPDVPPRLAGLRSATYGEIPPAGWGSGRTGEHTSDAWALVVPGRSHPAALGRQPHIVDIAATVCAVLGVDRTGLDGEPLLVPAER
jgi:predicted AlkP superfamily phosphohydrolase/phosphomutase